MKLQVVKNVARVSESKESDLTWNEVVVGRGGGWGGAPENVSKIESKRQSRKARM